MYVPRPNAPQIGKSIAFDMALLQDDINLLVVCYFYKLLNLVGLVMKILEEGLYSSALKTQGTNWSMRHSQERGHRSTPGFSDVLSMFKLWIQPGVLPFQ